MFNSERGKVFECKNHSQLVLAVAVDAPEAFDCAACLYWSHWICSARLSCGNHVGMSSEMLGGGAMMTGPLRVGSCKRERDTVFEGTIGACAKDQSI